MEDAETAFVYTLSSRDRMVQQCLRSIATLKNYVEPENIKIFYTPPYDEEDEKALRETGAELIKKENRTEAFSVSRSLPERHYGEKMNLCSLEEDTVVFLDCDTVVGNDIWEVIEGDYDFKARPGTLENEESWIESFREADEPVISWMPNAGFMVFKNGTHREIRESWKEYYSSDIEFDSKTNRNEQHALALAVSGKDLEKMTREEHVFEWNDEKVSDGYVYHLDQSAGSSVLNAIKSFLRMK